MIFIGRPRVDQNVVTQSAGVTVQAATTAITLVLLRQKLTCHGSIGHHRCSQKRCQYIYIYTAGVTTLDSNVPGETSISVRTHKPHRAHYRYLY